METLDKHFRNLTQPVFARYGFAQAELVGRWTEIVGEELGAISAPGRVNWPRADQSARKSGGKLTIKALAGRSLDVEYAVPRILERLNAFYGYGAITEIRVTRAASLSSPAAGSASRATAPAPVPVEGIADDALAQALGRLGAAVTAKSSPQAK